MSIYQREQLLYQARILLDSVLSYRNLKILNILLDILNIRELSLDSQRERIEYELRECRNALNLTNSDELKIQLNKNINEITVLKGGTSIIDRDFADYLYRMSSL